MKKLLIVAAIAGCMTFASCHNEKTPDDYANELVELTLEGMEAQLDGAGPEDLAKYEARINEIEKEVKEITKEKPDFEQQLMEAYQKELTNNPKYKELMEKAMQQYMGMGQQMLDVTELDADNAGEMADEVIEETVVETAPAD